MQPEGMEPSRHNPDDHEIHRILPEDCITRRDRGIHTKGEDLPDF
jgi:hypothetical protein